MQLLTTLLSVLALAASTTASPIAAKRNELIVVSPSITSPHKGDTWSVGSVQVVTWDTFSIPPEGQHNTGTILLGFSDGTGSEHLDVGEPP
jgi:hypothetical protein